MLGVQAVGGALNVTLNDSTTKGAYMPDGSLRVTDSAGTGIMDASGALRISAAAGLGVYVNHVIHYKNATSDGLKGSYFTDGSLRMNVVAGGSGITITLYYLLLAPNNPSGWRVGVATLSGGHTGTPVWSLANNAGGRYAIDSSTGEITMLTGLVTGTDTIIASVSGVTPAEPNTSKAIPVANSLDFSQPGNSSQFMMF